MPRSPVESRRTAMLGAAFLMATSAIGPGFLTQTAVFTERLGASFGFAILVSVVFDLFAQLNIWRVLVGSGEKAQAVANAVVPGLGLVLSALVALGGLAFNIGNVAGAGLGLNVMTGLDLRVGAAISAGFAVALFLSKDLGRAMDWFSQIMGGLMIVLAGYVAIIAAPPLGEALVRTALPTRLDPLAVVTIVGGTVGGYITFAGAHRLVDAGMRGPLAVPAAIRSAALGISVATVMRVVLFLGALGVIAGGGALDPANPPASVFRLAAGEVGYRLFGVVMWAAAITSIVGSAYTSATFLKAGRRADGHAEVGGGQAGRALIIGFIVVSTVIFLLVGRPVTILILVGAINGMILPLGLGAMLLAARTAPYRELATTPIWLLAGGLLVAVAMAALGGYTLATQIPALIAGPR